MLIYSVNTGIGNISNTIWYKEIKKKHALMGYATIFAIYEKEKVALLKLIAK